MSPGTAETFLLVDCGNRDDVKKPVSFGLLPESCPENSPGTASQAAFWSSLVLQCFSLPVDAFEKLSSIKIVRYPQVTHRKGKFLTFFLKYKELFFFIYQGLKS